MTAFDAMGDDELEALVARAFAAAEPVPDAVVAAALGAEAWRTIDADLAALAFDSLESAGGARSGAGARQLTFQSDEREVELDVLVTEGADASLEGMLLPAQPGDVELQSTESSWRAPVDAIGRFRFTHVPRGPVRFALHAGDRPILTTWVVFRPS